MALGGTMPSRQQFQGFAALLQLIICFGFNINQLEKVGGVLLAARKRLN
jgi:hypothetical protein